MNINSFSLLFFILSVVHQPLFAQITVTEIEKKQTENVDNSTPYDKIYIGKKYFLPPYPNPAIGTYKPKNAIIFYTENPTEIGYHKDNCVYKPFTYYDVKDCKSCYKDVRITTCSNADSIANNYYTVLKVFKGNLFGGRKDSYDDDFYDGKYIFFVKNEKNEDSIYIDINTFQSFIPVQYFEQLKNMYNGKILIYIRGNSIEHEDLNSGQHIEKLKRFSKWQCEVNVIDIKKDHCVNCQNHVCQYPNNQYHIYFVLKNTEENQTFAFKYFNRADSFDPTMLINDPRIILTDDSDKDDEYNIVSNSNLDYLQFLTEPEFVTRITNLKIEKEKEIAKNKKANQIYNQKEKTAKQIHLTECINKFGQVDGELIARGIVKIGMTKEMCKAAWGNPYNTYKMITKDITIETWNYGLVRKLVFANGILNTIAE